MATAQSRIPTPKKRPGRIPGVSSGLSGWGAGERITSGIGDWPRAPEPKEGSGQRV
jgi:hypothetical protein